MVGVTAAKMTGAEIKAKYEAEDNAFTDTKNTKLAGIDEGAKDDQTGAEIKAAYETVANAFTDAKNTKLAGIEEGAKVGDMTRAVYDSDDDNWIELAEVGVSDSILGSSDVEASSSSSTYVKLKELTLTMGNAVKGNITLRIKFDLKGSVDNVQYVYGYIYRNDSPVGAEQSNVETTYSTKSQDIDGWNNNDRIQLYVKRAGTETGYYQNFRVYGTLTSHTDEDLFVGGD